MPILTVSEMSPEPASAIFRRSHHSVTWASLSDALPKNLLGPSWFWAAQFRFEDARKRLLNTANLKHNWNTYGSAPPNDTARTWATILLGALVTAGLPPSRLLPSAEGGIAFSFVRGDRRAEIEIYNSGEVAAAIYGGRDNEAPVAWDVEGNEVSFNKAIEQIRVHLSM